MRCKYFDKTNWPKELGVKTEIKNVNSFRYVQKAIEYEIIRQSNILDKGDEVVQERQDFLMLEQIKHIQ